MMSYSGDPATSPKDFVRFLLRDTGQNEELSDAEISFLLGKYSNNAYTAAAACAETIATTYAGKADKTVGPLSIKYSTLTQNYSNLAKKLKEEGSHFSAGKVINTQRSKKPSFYKGQFSWDAVQPTDSGNPDRPMSPYEWEKLTYE